MEFARISQNFAKFAEEQASEKHRAEKSLKITGKYSQSVEISILCDRMVGIGNTGRKAAQEVDHRWVQTWKLQDTDAEYSQGSPEVSLVLRRNRSDQIL